ncbi:MAG: hypothetical protein HY719_04750 [Planctomycetes bacterium]|nr:hypothetical protein [Planctomycetota bacterium]
MATIGAAGSLGRMEASDLSDADLIIVLSDNVAVESQEANQIYGVVWDALGSIQRPNPRGVFAGPTSTAHLLARIGHGAENLGTIGKRLLLLLEAQPVYGDGQFEMVVHNLVDRYASEYVASDPRKEWTFLINDLIRYFRSICVHYQSTFDDQHEHDKWVLRNVKLRHSRLIMYVGLLALLGECSKVRDHKVEWLKQRLRWTPLERLAAVYEANTDWAFFRLAGLYDVFTGRVSDPCVRGGLQVGYADRYVCRAFAELKANSDALAAELSRFVLDRRGSWTDRFFEYLLF